MRKFAKALCVFVLLAGIATTARSGEFYGELALDGNPDDSTGNTRILRNDFGFEDVEGLRWQTNAGDITDGASIPEVFQSILGGTFSAEYIKAAVIHDRYCDEVLQHRVRPWRDTHRMFYDALLSAGVTRVKAKLIFYAVFTFGPRWDKLDTSAPCGNNCINVLPDYKEFYRPSLYDGAGVAAELQRVEKIIAGAELGTGIKLRELELLSNSLHSEDEFLVHSITQ